MPNYLETQPPEILNIILSYVDNISDLASVGCTSLKLNNYAGKLVISKKVEYFERNSQIRKEINRLFSKDFGKRVMYFSDLTKSWIARTDASIGGDFSIPKFAPNRNYITTTRAINEKIQKPNGIFQYDPSYILNKFCGEVRDIINSMLKEINETYIKNLVNIQLNSSRKKISVPKRGSQMKSSKLKRMYVLKCISSNENEKSTLDADERARNSHNTYNTWWRWDAENENENKSFDIDDLEELFLKNGKFLNIIRNFIKTIAKGAHYNFRFLFINNAIFVKMDDDIVIEFNHLIKLVRGELIELTEYGFETRLFYNIKYVKKNEIDFYVNRTFKNGNKSYNDKK
jgi:hypothetical protein